MSNLKDSLMSLIWVLPHDPRRRLYSIIAPGTYKTYQDMRDPSLQVDHALGPFDETESIFVHIPKCAGISVTRALYGRLVGTHHGVKSFQMIYSKAEMDHYFKFTIVRNPWSRLVSAYTFLKSGGLTDGDKAWAKEHLSQFDDFGRFVREWVNPKNVLTYIHFNYQHRYVVDPNGYMPIDYVGYFENLKNDFKNIASIMGKDVELPHHNPTKSKVKRLPYTEMYDDETRQIVADVYRQDIERFGYTFDNSGIESRFPTEADVAALKKRFGR